MTSPVSMFLFMCLCMCVCVSMFRCVHIKSQLKSETACNRYFKWKITSQRKFKKYIKDFHRLSSFIWIKYADKGSSPGFTGIFYSHEKSISKRSSTRNILFNILILVLNSHSHHRVCQLSHQIICVKTWICCSFVSKFHRLHCSRSHGSPSPWDAGHKFNVT